MLTGYNAYTSNVARCRHAFQNVRDVDVIVDTMLQEVKAMLTGC